MGTPDGNIRPIEWVSASHVHPHEAHDFTPWLSRHLELLADVLGLDEVTLEGTEVLVGDYRLDILAQGQLGEESWPIAVENQYLTTDHRHLGQLITYLAQQEQGYAVWVVEDASDQHVAAIEFLNRTTIADFSYWLLRVRFTPSGDGYQVFFDVLSRPNEFIRSDTAHRGVGGASVGNRTVDERFEFHSALVDRLRPPLTEAGWRNVAMHKGGWSVRMLYPKTEPLADWGRVVVRSHADHYYVHLLIAKGDADTNRAVVDLLEDRYGAAVAGLAPPSADVRWHEAGKSADGVKIVFQGDGFFTDPAVAANQVGQVALGWLELLRTNPILDLDGVVVTELGS